SRRSRSRLTVICSRMVITDSHHTCPNAKPGWPDHQIAGTAKVTMRLALDSTDGTVLPNAWNMPEQVKMMPWATKFHEITWRNPLATATTAASLVKRLTSQS